MNVTGAQSHGAGSTLAVTGGAVNLNTNAGANLALGVSGGATATFNASQHLRGLNISGGSKVDLKDQSLIVAGGAVGSWAGGAYSGLTGQIASGRNGGSWDGPGLITSAATPGSNHTTIGIVTADDLGIAGGTWHGESVSSGDVLAMYTYGGDANLDRKINIDDYGRIDAGVGQSGSVHGWYNGDFNYDGAINIDDYGIIDGNIGSQGAPMGASMPGGSFASSVAAVPEPAAVSLFGLGLLAVRRRRRQPGRRG